MLHINIKIINFKIGLTKVVEKLLMNVCFLKRFIVSVLSKTFHVKLR